MNKDKKIIKSNFNKFLKIYVLILILITIIVTIYIGSTLKKYENNQVDNYMNSVISDLKEYASKNEIIKHIDSININKSEFERDDASFENGINELFKTNADIKYEINENSKDEIKPIYNIYLNDYKILEVALDGSDIETRLSLLTFSNWKISYINVEAEKGLLNFEISLPSNYEIYVNDKKLTEEQIVSSNSDNNLDEISKYVEIPYAIKYEVSGLIEKPNYKILDKNGNEVKEQDIKIVNEPKKFATMEEAIKEINNCPDIKKIAEDWSLFLSDDLNGSTHGFNNISEYLIKDSYLYNYAYKWATNVDITFISRHTLKNPTFTNEKISNFIVYNEKAFSCDVYVEKNMRIANGNDLTDKLNERMYFAYYDETLSGMNNSSWKLVNMQSLTNN